jgi:anti-anti-sigma factor
MTAKSLQVMVSREGDVTVVRLSGPVDSEYIEVFKEKMDPVAAVPQARVLLDCTELTYLNSRAIGLLLKYYRQIGHTLGKFVLLGVDKKMVRTLDLLHLGKELLIYGSREEALAALR